MVALEYFDQVLHPTCDAFGKASQRLFEEFTQSNDKAADLILEIGPGQQPKAELFSSRSILYVDDSLTMLDYAPSPPNVIKRVASADNIPLDSDSADYVLASLGDPYNTESFWMEISRVLKSEGICIYTTPSYQWSMNYRRIEGSPEDCARFALRNGLVVDLPSFVFPQKDQVALMERCGFQLIETREFMKRDIEAPIAPKIATADIDTPIVTMFVVRNRNS